MMKPLRLFIAINLDSKTRELLYKLQNQLIEITDNNLIRLIKKQNLHLTLHFLGNIENKKINLLKKILLTSTTAYKQFEINFTGIGCFPNYKKPRIVWAGIEDKRNQLYNIHKSLSENLTKNKFEIENRPYKAHCTLAYVKKQCSKDKLQFIGKRIKEASINQICLYQPETISLIASELSHDGAIYKTITEIRLEEK